MKATPAESSEQAVLVESALDPYTGGNDAIASEIYGEVAESVAADAAALRKAIASGNLHGIVHASHRIASSCSMVGAPALAQVALSIETAGRELNLGGARQFLPQFELAYAHLHERLSTLATRRARAAIRVVLCDDHAVVRRGIARLLERGSDISVVGEAANYEEVRRLLKQTPCDVLVLDIEMPGKNGIEALALLRKEQRDLKAIILSMFPETLYAVRALRAGAAGYVNKASGPEQLGMAVRTVASGRKFISPEMTDALATSLADPTGEPSHEKLSDREMEVLLLIARGKRLSEIAKDLALSPKTVSVYRANVLEKLRLANNVEAALYAVNNGLVTKSEVSR